MNEKSFFEKFYGVFFQAATWLNAAYLFLTFPLGIAYFVFLVTGWSLGIGLAVIWIGLLVLLLVFAVSWGLSAFERWLLAIPGWHIAWDWDLTLFNGRVFIAQPDPYLLAGLFFLIGVFAAPASLHLLNWMAGWQGKLAQKMLGRQELAADRAGVAEAPVKVVEAAEVAVEEAAESVEVSQS